MDKKKFTQILEQVGYSEDSIKSLRSGRSKPRYYKMVELNKRFKIPFTAWMDIKSYLQVNTTTSANNKAIINE